MADQEKVHNNPFSKEGLGKTVMDMGVVIAKLSTDMDWVKDTLKEIKETLEENNREYRRVVEEMRQEFDEKLSDHEERITDLEKKWSWLKGGLAGLGTIATIMMLIEVIHALGWL